MASQLSQSSVATVVEDLVTDRNIALKVVMIIINAVQIILCWVCVSLFVSTFIEKDGKLELPLTLGFLLVGSYLIPGVTNGVIYYLRWKKSTPSNRRRIQEENKLAWVCLRLTLTLIGLPTAGRYIESIIVSKKLDNLEKQHMKSSLNIQKENIQLQPKASSKLGGTAQSFISNQQGDFKNNNTRGSVLSGISQTSSINGIGESDYRRVRRARRQYKRCEHDGALLSLVAGSAGGGPMAILMGFLYLQRLERTAPDATQTVIMSLTFALNIVWLSATLSQFYPARHVQTEAEFERGIRNHHFIALILVFLSHAVQTTLRVIILSIFTCWFYAYVFIPLILQWLVGTISFIVYRRYMHSKTVGVPINKEIMSVLSAMYYGFVGIFDFVNGNQGKTRLRYLIYYAFYYAENITMLILWVVLYPSTQIVHPIPFICVLLALFWLGFGLLQVYLFYYSQSPYGTSIFGFCCGKHSERRNMDSRYAEEVRDPVFGVALSETAMPLTPTGRNRSSYPTSNLSHKQPIHTISGTGRIATMPTNPSILSSKSPPSIISNHGPHTVSPSYQPHVQMKLPPVMQHKSKQNNRPAPLPTIASGKKPHVQSSDDDSSNDDDYEAPVFSPKSISQSHSNPDLTMSPSTDDSSFNTATPQVAYIATPHPGPLPAKSLDNLNRRQPNAPLPLVPAISPAANKTKPISAPPAKPLKYKNHPQQPNNRPSGGVTRPRPASNIGVRTSHHTTRPIGNPPPNRSTDHHKR